MGGLESSKPSNWRNSVDVERVKTEVLSIENSILGSSRITKGCQNFFGNKNSEYMYSEYLQKRTKFFSKKIKFLPFPNILGTCELPAAFDLIYSDKNEEEEA